MRRLRSTHVGRQGSSAYCVSFSREPNLCLAHLVTIHVDDLRPSVLWSLNMICLWMVSSSYHGSIIGHSIIRVIDYLQFDKNCSRIQAYGSHRMYNPSLVPTVPITDANVLCIVDTFVLREVFMKKERGKATFSKDISIGIGKHSVHRW
jgi:hypothetical protein